MCECSKLDHVANLLQYLAVVIKSRNVSSSDVDDIRRIIEHVAVELGRVAERLDLDAADHDIVSGAERLLADVNQRRSDRGGE
jgi:hypothetical protein